MTAEVSLQIGMAVATVLRSSEPNRNRVVLGKDTRISGYMIESALTSGLLSMGMDVFLAGPLPTPAVALLTKSMGAAAGVMITASHNPYEDNGVKVFGPDGFKLTDDLEALVERHVMGEEPKLPPLPPEQIGKAYRIDDARARYIEFAKQTAGNIGLHGMKIVVDCGHGAAYCIAPLIFRDLGAEVIAMGIEPDGVNINHKCGALHPETAAALAKEHGADLGISFDGDADRVIFSDANGQVVSGDKILAMCAMGLKQQGRLQKDTLVATVMSNLGLADAMGKQGIKVVTTSVGDRHVIECLRKHGYAFGGENSGHLIFADHSTTGDGILSALQVLRLMRENDASLAELSGIMSEYPSALVNLPVLSKPPLDSMGQLNELLQEADQAFGGRGRHLVRYSGTENVIRIFVEHVDAVVCRDWLDRLTAGVRDEIGGR